MIADGGLAIEDRAVGQVIVPAETLHSLEYRGERVVRLEDIPFSATGAQDVTASEGVSTDGTILGVPARLIEGAAERSLGIAAGTSATFDLGGKYRNFVCTAGVPAALLPSSAVTFIATADGKEIFRSPPRTSIDDPLAINIKVDKIKSLTLKVESSDPKSPVSLPGVWMNGLLTRP
jgi:hypothetical protein